MFVIVSSTIIVILSIYQVESLNQRYNIPQILEPSSRLQHPHRAHFYTKCLHQICNHALDYPEQEIKKTMEDKISIRGLFGIILNSTYQFSTIQNRVSSDDNIYSVQLCKTDGPLLFYPKVMRNISNQWKYIVNVGEYKQIFSAEICRTRTVSGHESNNYCDAFGSQCKQNYKELYLLTYEDGFLDFDKFLVPTSCDCTWCSSEQHNE